MVYKIIQGVADHLRSDDYFGLRADSRTRRVIFADLNRALVDGLLSSAALVLAMLIRFDGELVEPYALFLPATAILFGAIYVGSAYAFGVYNLVWRLVSLRDVILIGKAVLTASLLVTCCLFILPLRGNVVPFGVAVLHPVLTMAAWIGVRVFRRVLDERPKTPAASGKKRVLLIGAGKAGISLLKELKRKGEFAICGFLDDDPQLHRRVIDGYPVLGTTEDLEEIFSNQGVEEVILCMPSVPKRVANPIISRCRNANVRVSSVPSMTEIISGRRALDMLHSINGEDLLQRESVGYSMEACELKKAYFGRRILVTGAGGSIGSELARQLIEFEPSLLILIDKDENNLFEIDWEIRQSFDRVCEVVGDIRDPDRLHRVFEEHRPEVVFHAAAYKHVPLMERYPEEAILNNVIGTRVIAEKAVEFGTKTFVMISTDKAVNPTSVMGASKRVAEMVVQKIASRDSSGRFCCVRFGNVLGSRGSVVPTFQKLISQGKDLQVTHPEVKRYFMTIPEAVQLVIQAGTLGRRGEVFLLDMGEPVKIVDLARNLIRLSGLVPEEDIKIEFSGLRPGEKLFEELVSEGDENIEPTKHPKIMMTQPSSNGFNLNGELQDLELAARRMDRHGIRRLLTEMGISYTGMRTSDRAVSFVNKEFAIRSTEREEAAS